MKIHYLSRSTLISDSANSVHVLKMCDSFTALGHDVTLHGYEGAGELADIAPYYGTKNDFRIIRHNENAAGLSALLWKARAKIPLLKVGGIPSFLYAWQNLRAPLRKNADLVFSRNIFWLPAVPRNIPFIFESHTPPANFLQKHIEKTLFQRKNCKGVVVISGKMQEIYEEMFPRLKGKFIIAHDGADDPHPQNIEERLARPLKNIGYVGQLYKGRGIEIILQCAARLPQLNFHIVGGQSDLIETYKSAANVPDNVIFHGHQPHAILPEYYRTFDAVLAPYQTKVAVAGNAGDTSAFMSPLKIFEYMSWGLPIVCSDMPVLREVLKDGETALLAKPDDTSAWVDALNRLAADAALKAALSHNARAQFLSHYTWKSRAADILQRALGADRGI